MSHVFRSSLSQNCFRFTLTSQFFLACLMSQKQHCFRSSLSLSLNLLNFFHFTTTPHITSLECIVHRYKLNYLLLALCCFLPAVAGVQTVVLKKHPNSSWYAGKCWCAGVKTVWYPLLVWTLSLSVVIKKQRGVSQLWLNYHTYWVRSAPNKINKSIINTSI